MQKLEESERLTMDIPKHRAFTYQEKKINRMTQADLIEFMFIPKIQVDKVILWRLQEEGEKITVRDARLLKLGIEDRFRKKIPQTAFDHIFNVFELKKVYKNLTTIESMAIHQIHNEILVEKYGKLDVGFKKDMKFLIKAIDQFHSNWDQAIENLNKNQE